MAPYQSLVLATIVHAPSLGQLEIVPRRLIAINPLGFIADIVDGDSAEAQAIVVKASQQTPTVTVIELPRSSFLLPTFVDLHLHAPQFLYVGTGLHLPLLQWLDEYAFKAEEQIDGDERLARTVYTSLAEQLIEYGTGAVLLFGTLKEQSKLRCLILEDYRVS